MKKLLPFAVLLVAITVLAAFRKAGEPLKPGDAMPGADTKMKDISGKMISFADARKENGLLVMFSCNTCPYVIKNQDRTNEIIAHAAKNKVGVIILNSNEAKRGSDDSFDEMKKYAAGQQYGNAFYTVDENSAMADAFGANRTPECFLFGKENKLIYHGAIDDNPTDAAAVTRKHLAVAIDEMVAGKEVSVKFSRSVGCTIKRKS
jgi:thioredoxin-related protein